MARFTLIERPTPGDETFVPPDAADPQPPLNRRPGDRWLVMERALVDRRGRQRGTFVVNGTFVKIFPNDALISFHGTNTLDGRGAIGTQGVLRFSEFDAGRPPVIIAIVGGTGEFEKARGTVTLDHGRFTFDVN